MKKLFFLLIVIMVFNSCDRDGQIFGGKDQLPPETQTGANTVGCLVNGKVFLPKKEGINPEVNCFYQLVNGKYFFTMAFSDLRGSSIESVSVQSGKVELQIGQTYILNKNSIIDGDFVGGGGSYLTTLQNIYRTNTIKSGELKITKIDPTNSIISGTFWFDAVNSAGEVVQIREGRFDWNY